MFAVVLACLACLGCFAPHAARAQQGAAEPRFDVLEFVVLGNTVLPVLVVEEAVYPFLGEQRVFADVEAARLALEKAYRSRGFGTVSVDVPEQRVEDGIVRLQVVEGRVARLRVTGSRYFSQGYILEKVASVAEGKVPDFNALQAELGSVNRTADRRVTPVLRAGPQPGTAEVDLTVEDRLPLHGSLELNNRASPNTTSTRLVAGLRYDNLWQRDHSLSLQAQVSPEKTDEVRVLSGSYVVPGGTVGQDSTTFSFIRSDSSVPAGVGDTTVFGRGRIYGLRHQRLLHLAEGRYHALTLGVDYKDIDEQVAAGGDEGFTTPIKYLPFSAAYQGFADDFAGRWQFGAGTVIGVRGLFSTESEFAEKRFLATGGFLVLKGQLGHEYKLGPGWSISSTVDAQFSGQPLVSNEQYVAGGVDSVRGYLEAAAVGDMGLRGSLELRWNDLAPKDWRWLPALRGHLFIDAAALELNDPLPGQLWRFRLAGAGFGLRASGAYRTSLALDAAWALRTLGSTRSGDFRLHASGAVEF